MSKFKNMDHKFEFQSSTNFFIFVLHRKQIKSFSIRKATNPNQARNAQASADMADESMKYGSINGDGSAA